MRLIMAREKKSRIEKLEEEGHTVMKKGKKMLVERVT